MPNRATVWILGDQLRLDHPALAAAASGRGPAGVRVAMVESRSSSRRLPFHRKRQVLHWSAGRHFAAELRAAGYDVDVIVAEDPREGLARHIQRHRTTRVVSMAAADHAPRSWQCGSMAEDLGVPTEVLPNTMFLVGTFNPIPDPEPGRRYVMEAFYRALRVHFNLLIEPDGGPTAGTWNLDAENRKPLPRTARIPPLRGFAPDAITRAAMKEVEASGFGVGSTEGFDLPVTRADAKSAFAHFLRDRLAQFGPYEDAMRRSEGVLYHSVLSPQMNLGLLEPLAMARAAEQAYRAGRVPLNSAEGFIRQVVGWREFMYWQYHRQMPGLRHANAWNATRPLPRMFWDGETDLECIRSVVHRLLASGYTHHIERLMVLSNFALLAGIDPAAVADWFLTFYADSHDWVVLPNVIGMGLNADGGVTATKPYIASAAYIKRMGDFCKSCVHRADLRTGASACPFNTLYWNFLIEHEKVLRAHPRLGPAVLGLRRIGDAERAQIRTEARGFLDGLEPMAWSQDEAPVR